MKRYLAILFSIVMGITLLIGCDSSETSAGEPTGYDTVNTLDGVSMIVEEGSITNTGLTVLFENTTDEDYIYGSPIFIEKNIEGDWYKVPMIVDEYAYDDIGHELKASAVSEWTADWKRLYGELDVGEYRIIKDVLEVREPGDYDTHHLTAEFVIK